MHRGLVEGRKQSLARLRDIGLDATAEVQLGALVVDIPTGEIQAVLAGRDHRIGFHRVLDARRQIGSLVKPFVVAAAIEEDTDLHAGSLVRDEAVSILDDQGAVWAPKNYDRTEQGVVRLETVVAKQHQPGDGAPGLWGRSRSDPGATANLWDSGWANQAARDGAWGV